MDPKRLGARIERGEFPGCFKEGSRYYIFAAACPLIILLGGVIRQFVSPAHKVDDAYHAGLDHSGGGGDIAQVRP